jgi:hypothetical protein
MNERQAEAIRQRDIAKGEVRRKERELAAARDRETYAEREITAAILADRASWDGTSNPERYL